MSTFSNNTNNISSSHQRKFLIAVILFLIAVLIVLKFGTFNTGNSGGVLRDDMIKRTPQFATTNELSSNQQEETFFSSKAASSLSEQQQENFIDPILSFDVTAILSSDKKFLVGDDNLEEISKTKQFLLQSEAQQKDLLANWNQAVETNVILQKREYALRRDSIQAQKDAELIKKFGDEMVLPGGVSSSLKRGGAKGINRGKTKPLTNQEMMSIKSIREHAQRVEESQKFPEVIQQRASHLLTPNISMTQRIAKMTIVENLRQFSKLDWKGMSEDVEKDQQVLRVIEDKFFKTNQNEFADVKGSVTNREIVCLLSMLHSRNCFPFKETFLQCYLRIGVRIWKEVLNPRCVNSKFWTDILPQTALKILQKRQDDHQEQQRKSDQQAPHLTKTEKRKTELFSSSTWCQFFPTAGMSTKLENLPTCKNPRFTWKNMSFGKILESQTYVKQINDESKDWIKAKTNDEILKKKMQNQIKEYSSPFPPPRICKQDDVAGCKTFPIGIGYPREAFVDRVPRTKAFDFMPLLPPLKVNDGRQHEFGLGILDEDLYRELLSQSFFAFTSIRAGADALRHYEILAAGLVPFFFDLKNAPKNSIGHLPRELLMRIISYDDGDDDWLSSSSSQRNSKKLANKLGIDHILKQSQQSLPDSASSSSSSSFVHRYTMFHDRSERFEFIKLGSINPNRFNETLYFEVADKLLEYSKKYLTTRAVANYFLKSLEMQQENLRPKKVLFFGSRQFDYMSLTLIHGLSDLEIEVDVVSSYELQEHLWKIELENWNHPNPFFNGGSSAKSPRKLRDAKLKNLGKEFYGYGFGFANRLHPKFVNRPWIFQPEEAVRKIQNKEYQLVVFAMTQAPFYNHVETAKAAGAKVAFLQFGDAHGDPNEQTRKVCSEFGGPVFIREMNDKEC